MNADQENRLARREIMLAYVKVLERPGDLLRVCAGVSGDGDEVRAAVEKVFDLSPFAADAVLQLQVRRFTPAQLHLIRAELAEVERAIAEDRA